jgi:hypothetical protein
MNRPTRLLLRTELLVMPDRNHSVAGESTEFSRRSVLRAMGAGVGASAFPGGVGGGLGLGTAGGELRGSDIPRNRAEWSQRGQLCPVGSDSEGGPVPQRLTPPPRCIKPQDRPIYGPTDVNERTANGSLAVATNHEGAMTVSGGRGPRSTST